MINEIPRGKYLKFVSALFCNQYLSNVEYNNPMTKVDSLAAVILLILCIVGLVNDQKWWRKI